MSTWSLNIWGSTEDGAALTATITALVEGLGSQVEGGSLNVSDRPQVTYPQGEAAPPNVGGDVGTPPDFQATTPAQEAPADPAPANPEAPADPAPTPSEPDAAPADPLASLSVADLEAEINRRSAEGQSITSDGSLLQEATLPQIEGEISSRGTPEAA